MRIDQGEFYQFEKVLRRPCEIQGASRSYVSVMILESLMSQHNLFAVPMTDTEPAHGYNPMEYDANSEADKVYQRCPVRTYTTQRGL